MKDRNCHRVEDAKETQQLNAMWDPVQSRNYKRRLVEKLMSVSIRILGCKQHKLTRFIAKPSGCGGGSQI